MSAIEFGPCVRTLRGASGPECVANALARHDTHEPLTRLAEHFPHDRCRPLIGTCSCAVEHQDEPCDDERTFHCVGTISTVPRNETSLRPADCLDSCPCRWAHTPRTETARRAKTDEQRQKGNIDFTRSIE